MAQSGMNAVRPWVATVMGLAAASLFGLGYWIGRTHSKPIVLSPPPSYGPGNKVISTASPNIQTITKGAVTGSGGDHQERPTAGESQEGNVFRGLEKPLPRELADLPTRWEQALKEWQVPGMAVSVVKNDQTVLAQGFGLRKIGEPQKVNAQTLFAIGSVTKGFTAAVVASLVDQGVMSWDDPPHKFLPALEFSAAETQQQATLQDLLCHRTGLPRYDELWYGQSLTRQEILQRVKRIVPESKFRTHFGYQNVMYLALGEASAAAGGQAWESLVEQRIFEPLEMKHSHASSAAIGTADDVATGHEKVGGKLLPLEFRNVDNCGPATGICSTARDMARWLRFHLTDGAAQGRQVISREAMQRLHQPLMLIPEDDNLWEMLPDKTSLAYGGGWQVMGYRERTVLLHPGNVNGYRSLVAIMPAEKLGVAILTNRRLTPLPVVVMYQVLDAYLGPLPADRLARRTDALKTLDHQYLQQAESRTSYGEGIKFHQQGKLSEAKAAFDRTLKLDPQSPYGPLGLALVLLSAGKFDDAIRQASTAIQRNPNSAHAWNTRGLARIQRGMTQDAVGDLRQALDIDPKFVDSWNNLALAYKNLHQWDDAISAADHTIQLNDRFAGAYAIRGLCRLHQGNAAAAQADFDTCLKLQPHLKTLLDREIAAAQAALPKP